ncbi:MAG: methyltransferase domain-containing protein [Chitinivibrionales bacterium]|nr:methyltransferase domain-containing protein [Chitinivibrionales bacterium]
MIEQKLNLGCGTDIRQGWINLDSKPLSGVDIVHDIEKPPLPFASESFETIECRNILEHVEYIPVMAELHRILKPAGTLFITVPHFSSRRNFIDPTHKKMFSIRTFNYFVENSPMQHDYYFDFRFTNILSKKITFEKSGFLAYNRVVESIVNAFPRLKEFGFEATLLCRLFPAESIHIVLQK